ncbi:hypothetical protein PG990_010319 [Apiospora arundinis]
MPTHGHAVATINGNVVAETDVYETVEGNVTHCPWKGDASYYTITVGGDELKNAAWYYPETKEKAAHFKDYVAFYKTKVNVTTD